MILQISSCLRVNGILGIILPRKRRDPSEQDALLVFLLRFFLLLHLRFNNADAYDNTAAAGMHPHHLHSRVHGHSGINQPVRGREHTLPVQRLDNLLLGKSLQERFPVLLIDPGHCIAVYRLEEAPSMALHGHLLLPGRRGILNELIRIQIHNIDVVIVRSQRPGNIRIAFTVIRLTDRKNSYHNSRRMADLVDSDSAGKGMHCSPIRQLLIIKRPASLLAARSYDAVHIGRADFSEFRSLLCKVPVECLIHKAAVCLIAPDIPEGIPLDLKDSHRQHVEGIPERLLILADNRSKIKKIDTPDCFKIRRFLRVLKADLGPFAVPFKNLLPGNRSAIIESLQFGTADVLKEAYLLNRLHAFAHRIEPQRCRHLHQFGQNDLRILAFIQPPDESHVELDQIELDALEDVKGGIAASKIIHPYRKSQILETSHLLLHEIKVPSDHALRDLDGDLVPANPRFVHSPADFFHNVTRVKISPGQIDGLRNDVKAEFTLSPDLLQNLIQNVQIQLVDQPGVLQHRNKIRG